MCEPSVTLYGTTVISQTTTYWTTWTSVKTQDPVIGLTTVEGKTVLATSTPEPITSIGSSYVTTVALSTSIVPQQTRYYPCSSAPSSATSSTSSLQSLDVNTFSSAVNAAPTFSSAVATSSSAATPTTTSASNSASSASLSSTRSGLSSVAVFSTSDATPTSNASSFPSSSGTISVNTSPALASLLSSASASFATTSTATAHSIAPTKSSSHVVIPVVASVVSVAAVFALFLLGMRLQRRGGRAGKTSIPKRRSQESYWERRFRALETGAIAPSGSRRASPGREGDEFLGTGSKKLHLTMNLESHALPSRPASRLSMISAFFTSKPVPQAAKLPLPGPAADRSSRWNLSRPLRHALAAVSDTTSIRSKKTSIRSKKKRWSEKYSPKKSTAGQPASFTWAPEERAEAPWVGWDGSVTVVVPKAQEQEEILTPPDDHNYMETRSANSFSSAKDSYRPIPSPSSATFGGYYQSNPPSTPAVKPFIPRSASQRTSYSSSTSTKPSGESESSARSVDSTKSFGCEEDFFPTPIRALISPTPSFRAKRESVTGTKLPELSLSREATTPSLWVKDDLFARLGYGGIEELSNVGEAKHNDAYEGLY
ncbi:hypothetical protein P7C73_g4282, partial [Tremellales sp. Uapishka_1]